MLAKIDDNPVAPDALYWPAMNFNQFRWKGTISRYELTLPRADFVMKLNNVYARYMNELKNDDRLIPNQQPSALRDAGYPSLNEVLDNAEASFELIHGFIYEDVFETFLPKIPSTEACFMMNSVDDVKNSVDSVVIGGRGYHHRPNLPKP